MSHGLTFGIGHRKVIRLGWRHSMPPASHIFDLLGNGRVIMEQQKSYTRVQQSWLAANERVVLIFIATSLPRWIKPDHLTILGVGGSLLCGIGFVASSLSACL